MGKPVAGIGRTKRMRHRNAGRKLSRNTSHRRALAAQPGNVVPRARASDDNASEGEGNPSACREDDHSRQARHASRSPAGAGLSAEGSHRQESVRPRSLPSSPTAKAVTAESSSSATAKATARILAIIELLGSELRVKKAEDRSSSQARKEGQRQERRKRQEERRIASLLGLDPQGAVRFTAYRPFLIFDGRVLSPLLARRGGAKRRGGCSKIKRDNSVDSEPPPRRAFATRSLARRGRLAH